MENLNTGLAILISCGTIVVTIVGVSFYFSGMRSELDTVKEKVKDLEDFIYKDIAKDLKKISESIVKVQSDIEHLKTKPMQVEKDDIAALIKAFVDIKTKGQ